MRFEARGIAAVILAIPWFVGILVIARATIEVVF